MKVDSFYKQSGLNLNESHELAVSNCDHAVSFIEGPPGTGKTTVITTIVAKALSNAKGVLVLGQTNFSVKQVFDSLMKNNICTDEEMAVIVVKDHFKEHKGEYSLHYSRHSPARAYKQVLLCTLSKAKRIPRHPVDAV